MRIKPIGERVLIKPVKVEKKTAGGIILPGVSEKTYPNRGEVVALGSESSILEINIGDIIVFEKNRGTSIETEEETYLILDREDILAVIE